LLRLGNRPSGVALPQVHVTDMSREGFRGDQFFFSETLQTRIEDKLADGQQVILYLNRRGYAPLLKCRACGFVPVCPHCQVNLTFHKSTRRMTCHYCGHVEAVPASCPACSKEKMLYLGAGTQKVEEALAELFPEARVLRLDSDSTDGRRRGHRILGDFGEGRADLLLGTQMVAKGLDFPGVTLVGVVSADLALDMPDFRASEKAFARLVQVAGRSGRARDPGEVIIQTYYPHLPLIDDVARQDYESFYQREAASRRELGFPPFGRLINVIVSGRDEAEVKRQMQVFRDSLGSRLAGAAVKAEILGPAPCPLYRLRGRYRRHLLIKTTRQLRLIKLLAAWEEAEAAFGLSSRVRLTLDVDPDNVM
jgi:primosomal protein N' (replication factor Y)